MIVIDSPTKLTDSYKIGTENAKAVASVGKLKEMMIEKMSELRTALEAITEKVPFNKIIESASCLAHPN